MDDSIAMSAPSTTTLPFPSPTTTAVVTSSSSTATCDALTNIVCPAGVDAEVFKELPVELQTELIASWRSSLVAAVEQTNGTGAATSAAIASGAPATATTASGQKNTLYRYFLRNK